MLSIGADGVSGFVGANKDSIDAKGFAINNVNVALAIMSERGGANRTWSALQASVGGFEAVGFNSLIEGVSFDFGI